jgi:hypothetical protein
VRAEVERLADLLRLCDVSLDDDRNCELGYEGLDERPRRRADAGGVGGIAAEGGGYDVGAGALCGESVVDGGDIGTDEAAEFCMDAADDLGPGLWFGEAATGAVESDDVCAGMTERLGGLEVRSDVDIAVGVAGLGEADDGEIGLGSEGGDARNAFRTETARSSAKDREGHAGEGVEVIERVAFGCLAGDDESAAKGLEDRIGTGGLAYRHSVFLQNAAGAVPALSSTASQLADFCAVTFRFIPSSVAKEKRCIECIA